MSYVNPHLFDTAYNLTVSSGDELSSNLVTTVGLTEIDDAEGGIFAWSPSSLETDDGTNVIQPSSVSGAGRWIRVSGQPAGDGTFTIPIAFEAGITVTTTEEDGNAITATGDGDGVGVEALGDGASATVPVYGEGAGLYAIGSAASNVSIYGVAGSAAGVGVEGDATDGFGVYGYASGTGYGGYFEADGSGPALYGDSHFGTGYGVVALADTSTPAKSALRIVPQDANPATSPATGDVYVNSGSGALCHYDGSNWVETGARYATASIASADITGTSAGQLGHANGVVIVPSPGAGYAIEFLSGVVILDFAGAAYTDGGNVTFNYAGGGAAVSTIVSNANSVTGAADKVALVLATAPTNNQLTAATGLNLVSASAPTQPGGATGVLRVKVSYRVHATGL